MTIVDRADVRSCDAGAPAIPFIAHERSGAAESASDAPSAQAVHPLTRDFLAWLAGGPRTYTEVMRAWQTSCPRLSIWEDALDAGLVASVRDEADPTRQVIVTLTAQGRAMLDGRG